MSEDEGKRRRPQPRYRQDLPIRVIRADMSGVGGLIGELSVKSPWTDARVVARLDGIITAYRTCRRLERPKPSRPEVNATLKDLGSRASALASTIARIPPDASARLAQRVHLEVPSTVERAVPHLRLIATAVEELHAVLKHSHQGVWADDQLVAQEQVRKMGDEAGELAARLFCLNIATEWALVHIQQYVEPQAWQLSLGALNAIADQLSWLSRVARIAYEVEAMSRGPKSDGVLYLAVKALLKLYSESTGRPATHSSSRTDGYRGVVSSPAGEWVWKAMQLIEPGGPQRGVLDAIEHVVWPSRQRPSEKRGPTATAEYQRRICEIVAATPA